MSVFLGMVGGFDMSRLQDSDARACQLDYQWDYAMNGPQLKPWADGMLWPSPRLGLGGDGYAGRDFAAFNGRWEAERWEAIGGAQAKKFVGTSRDSSSVALGNCVVRAFVTATNVLAGSTVSDAAGYFELCVWSSLAHYIVAYLAGSPDVAGTTVNTLTPV